MSKKYLVFFCNSVFENTSHLSLLFQLKFDFSIYNHTLVECIFHQSNNHHGGGDVGFVGPEGPVVPAPMSSSAVGSA